MVFNLVDVFLAMPTLYLDVRLTGFAKASKTSGAAKVYWRRLNSKRSLPVLEWTSESEYFFVYISIYIARPRAITLPLTAHARRGVIRVVSTAMHWSVVRHIF